jgi:hypothetical protein
MEGGIDAFDPKGRETCAMTAPDWTKLAARRPFLTPRAGRGAMDPATRLRKSPMPAILAVVRGGIRRMSGKLFIRDGADALSEPFEPSDLLDPLQ